MAQRTQQKCLDFTAAWLKNIQLFRLKIQWLNMIGMGFLAITKKLGKKVQIVGDDLFVTNTDFVKKGIQ